jgi:purine-binding chemotaxis protein CheW
VTRQRFEELSRSIVNADVLIFELDATRIGVAVSDVVEIARAVQLTPVPQAPRIIEGIVDVRGTLVPVVDLRQRFGLSPRALSVDEHLVIVRARARQTAFRADRSVGVTRIGTDQMVPVDDVVRGTSHVAGIARTPDGIVFIHDPATLLSQAEDSAIDLALRRFGAQND